MKREIIITADGSATIHMPEWDEQYHSKHGAIQEAYHVFIKNGLYHINENYSSEISVLEIGFGTGLNAFITFLEAEKLNLSIDYYGVEGYPITQDEIKMLNYVDALNVKESESVFNNFHALSWEDPHIINPKFSLTKQHKLFDQIEDKDKFDLIYFDAFGARVQPELWTEVIFAKMFAALRPKGVLVTYSAKGSVRRALQSVGFSVEKLPGPPGKREMLRATKG